ncbi:hypothetical protein ILUMI_06328 [Ignelater luminosus]|uniref:G-protein coupled receptors family 1 profile domain-containing protein n=1 Tax=Ignelater luminosus TaxID=2038154 RepID=A0A8K0D5M4_IGNLU|nr:hypothetical protein ILUMI_06328 [Ignelater luminosus]
MPQMISIPLAQFYPKSRFYHIFGKVADLLMCSYFALNPFVYVLHRTPGKSRCKLPCNCSKSASTRSRSTSTNGATVTTTDIIHLNSLASLAD